MRPSARAANSRPPLIAGRTVAVPPRVRRHNSLPSKPRRTTISPVIVTATSHPVSQSGGEAIAEPRSVLQSSYPSEARQPRKRLPLAPTTTPSPATGG